MTQIKKCIKKSPINPLVHLGNETPGYARGLMVFSGALKSLWYTWENKTPGYIRGVMDSSGFLKPSDIL